MKKFLLLSYEVRMGQYYHFKEKNGCHLFQHLHVPILTTKSTEKRLEKLGEREEWVDL